MDDHYLTLGLNADASQEDTRRAYLALIKTHHPDRAFLTHGVDQEAGDSIDLYQGPVDVRALNLAYSVLSDAQSRRRYDFALGVARSSTNKMRQNRPESALASHSIPSEAKAGRGFAAITAHVGSLAKGSSLDRIRAGVVLAALGLAVLPLLAVLMVTRSQATANLSALHRAGGAALSWTAAQFRLAPAAADPVIPFGRQAVFSWTSPRDTSSAVFEGQGLSLSLAPQLGDDGERMLSIRINTPGPQTVLLRDAFADPHMVVRAGVFWLDAASEAPQLVVQTYADSARCCTQVWVLTRQGADWRTLALTPLSAGTAEVRDFSGRGVADLMIPDNQFTRAFSSGATGESPPRFFSLRNSQLVETTHSRAFVATYAQLMQSAQEGCVAGATSACAAFVADAARIGRVDWAWRLMLKSNAINHTYKGADPCWGRLSGSESGDLKNRPCTTAEARFPDALHWFLYDAGYL